VAIVFDKNNKLIIVEAPDVEVTVQEIVDAVRDWQDELINMEVEEIIQASGKESLGGGVQVGITLELINDWRLSFEDRGGPSWDICTVAGGNLVATNAYNDEPIFPSAYVNTVIAQSTSASLISASGASLTVADIPEIVDGVWDEGLDDHQNVGSTGEALGVAASGGTLTYAGIADAVWDEAAADHLTPGSMGESQDLAASGSSLTYDGIADSVWDEPLSGHTTIGTAGEEVTGILDMLENRLVINQATSEWWLYNDAGDTVIKKWPLYDKDGNAVVLQGTVPADRGKRTL
jgi:hypothetical protein